MMDDDEYDVDEKMGTPIKSRRATPLDFVILFVILFQQIAEACSQVLDYTVGVMAGHANYRKDQTLFADAVRSELESIPTTEE
jgi:hypothetical protein